MGGSSCPPAHHPLATGWGQSSVPLQLQSTSVMPLKGILSDPACAHSLSTHGPFSVMGPTQGDAENTKSEQVLAVLHVGWTAPSPQTSLCQAPSPSSCPSPSLSLGPHPRSPLAMLCLHPGPERRKTSGKSISRAPQLDRREAPGPVQTRDPLKPVMGLSPPRPKMHMQAEAFISGGAGEAVAPPSHDKDLLP